MFFSPYGGAAALLAADLVNDPAAAPHELARTLTARGVSGRPTRRHAAALGEWSRRLAPCFGPQPLRERCERINALLADAASRPQISLHDGHPHLHYSAEDADLAARVRAITATGLSSVVCAAGPDRLGRCARAGCTTVYVDTSRNGRRRYCGLRCANTDAVRRHRAARTAR